MPIYAEKKIWRLLEYFRVRYYRYKLVKRFPQSSQSKSLQLHSWHLCIAMQASHHHIQHTAYFTIITDADSVAVFGP
jgi:hypothetical protein